MSFPFWYISTLETHGTNNVILEKIGLGRLGIPSIIIDLLLKGFVQTPLFINQPMGKGHLWWGHYDTSWSSKWSCWLQSFPGVFKKIRKWPATVGTPVNSHQQILRNSGVFNMNVQGLAIQRPKWPGGRIRTKKSPFKIRSDLDQHRFKMIQPNDPAAESAREYYQLPVSLPWLPYVIVYKRDCNCHDYIPYHYHYHDDHYYYSLIVQYPYFDPN